MDCTDCEDHMDRHLDDELAPATRAAVDQHLEGCPRCAAELEELAAIEAHYRADALTPPPEDLAARVRDAIAPGPRRGPRWVHPLRLLAVLGVVLAGFGLLRTYDDELFEWAAPHVASGVARTTGEALFVVRQKLALARYELDHRLLSRVDDSLAAAARELEALPASSAVDRYQERVRRLREERERTVPLETEEDALGFVQRAAEARRRGDHRAAAFASLDASRAYLQARRGTWPGARNSFRAALEDLAAAHRGGAPTWTAEFLDAAWDLTRVPLLRDLVQYGGAFPEQEIPDIDPYDYQAWDDWEAREPGWEALLAPRPKGWSRDSREYVADLVHAARGLAGRVEDPLARGRLAAWVVRKEDLPKGFLADGARLLEEAFQRLRAAVQEEPEPSTDLLGTLLEVAALRSACTLRGLGPDDPVPGPARYEDLLPTLEALPEVALEHIPGDFRIPATGGTLLIEALSHPSAGNPARAHVRLSWTLFRTHESPTRPAPKPHELPVQRAPEPRQDATLLFALQERALDFLRSRFADHPALPRWEAEVLMTRAEAREDLLPHPTPRRGPVSSEPSPPGFTETPEEFRARIAPAWEALVADLEAARSRLEGGRRDSWTAQYSRLHESLADRLAGERYPWAWRPSSPGPALRRSYWEGLQLPPPLGAGVPSAR